MRHRLAVFVLLGFAEAGCEAGPSFDQTPLPRCAPMSLTCGAGAEMRCCPREMPCLCRATGTCYADVETAREECRDDITTCTATP